MMQNPTGPYGVAVKLLGSVVSSRKKTSEYTSTAKHATSHQAQSQREDSNGIPL